MNADMKGRACGYALFLFFAFYLRVSGFIGGFFVIFLDFF